MNLKQFIAAVVAFFGAAAMSFAQSNLLVNGDFEATPADVYYDGSDPSIADDVPGWVMFLGAADGSYVLVSLDNSGTFDLDTANGLALGGLETAPLSRPAVTPSSTYTATLTYDNYFAPTGAAYFIDWFDASGSLVSSSGGPLEDPNGALTFQPYDQLLSLSDAAPAGAAAAGVRFESGNPSYSGLAADNFAFSADVGANPADFTGDGKVDGADLEDWEASFGPADNGADADADSDSDGADFLVWQRNLTAPSVPAGTPVPEPAAVALAMVCLIAASGVVSRRLR